MNPRDPARLAGKNDPVLEPLIRAAEGECAEREIEVLVVNYALPVTRRILARYARPDAALSAADADDIAATASLRLVAKLRAIRAIEDEAVEDLEDYVATTTYNLITDHFRRRFPERARLKNRLRYFFGRDSRFAMWTTPQGMACGLRQWSGRDAAGNPERPAPERVQAIADPRRPAAAIAELFRISGRPILLDSVVSILADAWNINDSPAPYPLAEPSIDHDPVRTLAESRQILGVLWEEIRALLPLQRKALLLNLRDNTTVNVTSLLVLTGTAGYDSVAEALEMTAAELAAVWNELPLDDLRIAGMLGVTRQQVINLRKTARARLSRRLAKAHRSSTS